MGAYMQLQILTVSQLNKYVKSIIEENALLSSLYIKGEISNFVNHYKSGHYYFTLKDTKSAVKCIMFASSVKFLKFTPTDGMSVILGGSVSLFERDGAFQFYATDMQPDGMGALAVAYEQLKVKLAAEGLFNQDRKKNISKMPKCIGLITSTDGAALKDMLNILSRRYPIGRVIIYPVSVQGTKAVPDIVKAINFANKENVCDTIILSRGGGSIEDLWAFNEEQIVRAVANSDIPIISAVGHEVDYTLTDFAADLRAATPSEAAELVALDINIIKANLDMQKSYLKSTVSDFIMKKIEDINQKNNKLSLYNPKRQIDQHYLNISLIEDKLDQLIKERISQKSERLSYKLKLLSSLNPFQILNRGYTFTFSEDNKKINDVSVGDTIKTITDSSEILSHVYEITKIGDIAYDCKKENV